jgi:NnrU protein
MVATTPAAAAAVSYLMTRSQFGWAVGGWTFFIAENALLSENREYIINAISSQGYYALYGTASTAATISILYGFRTLSNQSRNSSMLIPRTIPSIPRIGLAIVIQSVGLILASQAIPSLQIPIEVSNNKVQIRCPFDFHRDRSNLGLDRVSRHASLWALGLTTLGASLLQPSIPMSIWMMGPTAVALLGGAHADSRFKRGIGGHLDAAYERQTSNLPFYAMMQQGTVSYWLTEEVKPINAILAVTMASLWAISRRRLAVASFAHILRKTS